MSIYWLIFLIPFALVWLYLRISCLLQSLVLKNFYLSVFTSRSRNNTTSDLTASMQKMGMKEDVVANVSFYWYYYYYPGYYYCCDYCVFVCMFRFFIVIDITHIKFSINNFFLYPLSEQLKSICCRVCPWTSCH